MATFDEASTAVADTYAHALLDVAAARGDDQRVATELDELIALMDAEPALRTFFTAGISDRVQRAASIERLFRDKMCGVLVDTLQVMNDKERLALVEALRDRYAERRRERQNHVRVRVTSAVPLTPADRTALTEEMGRLTGKQVELVECVDESLVGGLIVQVGDRLYDSSVALQLRRMRGDMVERSTRELAANRTFSAPA